MNNLKTGAAPFFHRGIDSISHKGLDDAMAMPERYDLAPAELTRRPQTEQLLAAFTLDTFIEESLRPEIDDLDLLKPGPFRQKLSELHEHLLGQAKSLESTDPDTAKTLRRAARLLNDEVELHELLRSNFSALYQG